MCLCLCVFLQISFLCVCLCVLAELRWMIMSVDQEIICYVSFVIISFLTFFFLWFDTIYKKGSLVLLMGRLVIEYWSILTIMIHFYFTNMGFVLFCRLSFFVIVWGYDAAAKPKVWKGMFLLSDFTILVVRYDIFYILVCSVVFQVVSIYNYPVSFIHEVTLICSLN